MINLNLLISVIFKSLLDLGLTIAALIVIMRSAFFGFADKENWQTRIGQKLNFWTNTRDYGFLRFLSW